MDEKLIKEIAEWCTETGLRKTSSGNYYIEFSEVAEKFNIDVETIEKNKDDIASYIDCISINIDENGFDMDFECGRCCEYCIVYQEGNRCAEECEGICDIWCDEMDENYEPPVIKEFDKSERENIKVKDIAYCSYINRVGAIREIQSNENVTLYQIDGWGCFFHEKHIRKATEDEIKWYNAELEAKEWLKKRQKELKGLSFRFYFTNLWKEEKELLREAGYFVYDCRDWDEGDGYNIEKHVVANHIGCWITDMDLTPYMNEGSWIGIDELKYANMDEIPYGEIEKYLDEGRKLHFRNR